MPDASVFSIRCKNEEPQLFLFLLRRPWSQEGKDSIVMAHAKGKMPPWEPGFTPKTTSFFPLDSKGFNNSKPNDGRVQSLIGRHRQELVRDGSNNRTHLTSKNCHRVVANLIVKARYDSAWTGQTQRIQGQVSPVSILRAYLIYAGILASLLYFYLDRQRKSSTLRPLNGWNRKCVKERREHQLETNWQGRNHQNCKMKPQIRIGFKNWWTPTSFTYHRVNKKRIDQWNQDSPARLEKNFLIMLIWKGDQKVTNSFEQNSNIDEDWETFVKSFDQCIR